MDTVLVSLTSLSVSVLFVWTDRAAACARRVAHRATARRRPRRCRYAPSFYTHTGPQLQQGISSIRTTLVSRCVLGECIRHARGAAGAWAAGLGRRAPRQPPPLDGRPPARRHRGRTYAPPPPPPSTHTLTLFSQCCARKSAPRVTQADRMACVYTHRAIPRPRSG
jgi:hypothetical protein